MNNHKKDIFYIDEKSELEWLYVPDVEYADYNDCKRHIQMIAPYKPNWNGEKYPVIIYIEGSAWYKQDVYSKIPMLGNLAERGYAVASVEFRESTIAPFPAQVKDIKTAIRFLRSKAEDFHLDADNIYIFGGSSGGHIALLAGLAATIDKMDSNLYPEYSCEVNGIIACSAPTDIIKLRLDSSPAEKIKPADDLLGVADVLKAPQLAQKASCSMYIKKEKDIPPILLIHGTDDPIVKISQSEMLYDKLVKENKEVEFYSIIGAKHGGKIFWTKQVLDIIDEFINKHLT